jgi:daunorubicin resistance ABC transporter ATP-binding subunit
MSEHAIVVEGLKKHFDEVKALDGIDLEVPAGTIFGLLGPNGAGKTTAVRILATVLPPDAGRAEIMGFDVVRQADAVRRRIGLAGQNAAVDPNLTGRENLRMVGILNQMPKPAVIKRADELLERFGLSHAANRPLRTYSGGMRRRLDIAASLVQSPPVLLLDEPTTGLDVFSRNELWEMIRELVSTGTTVLLTTQYLEEADRLAASIAVVDGGKVIANDTPERLKADLGSTVVEIVVRGDGKAERATELLTRQLTGEHVERERDTVRITSNIGARVLLQALRSLDGEGLEPDALTVREPSIDDVFLALTGHRAEIEANGNGNGNGHAKDDTAARAMAAEAEAGPGAAVQAAANRVTQPAAEQGGTKGDDR